MQGIPIITNAESNSRQVETTPISTHCSTPRFSRTSSTEIKSEEVAPMDGAYTVHYTPSNARNQFVSVQLKGTNVADRPYYAKINKADLFSLGNNPRFYDHAGNIPIVVNTASKFLSFIFLSARSVFMTTFNSFHYTH
jgi:hypothetical protein